MKRFELSPVARSCIACAIALLCGSCVILGCSICRESLSPAESAFLFLLKFHSCVLRCCCESPDGGAIISPSTHPSNPPVKCPGGKPCSTRTSRINPRELAESDLSCWGRGSPLGSPSVVAWASTQSRMQMTTHRIKSLSVSHGLTTSFPVLSLLFTDINLPRTRPLYLLCERNGRVHFINASLDGVATFVLCFSSIFASPDPQMKPHRSLRPPNRITYSSPTAPTGDKSINYSVPDHMMPYTAHSIYPPMPFAPGELGHAPGNLTPSDVSSSISPPNGQMGNSKYSTSIPGESIAAALGQEESVRVAAEEDRRRRNTAASARFRMKKKQREQVLERTVRETTEKNASLEARVAQLEMENRWLKNLLTEKHEGSPGRMPAPPKDSSLDPRSNGRGAGHKNIQPKKKGVGTDE